VIGSCGQSLRKGSNLIMDYIFSPIGGGEPKPIELPLEIVEGLAAAWLSVACGRETVVTVASSSPIKMMAMARKNGLPMVVIFDSADEFECDALMRDMHELVAYHQSARRRYVFVNQDGDLPSQTVRLTSSQVRSLGEVVKEASTELSAEAGQSSGVLYTIIPGLGAIITRTHGSPVDVAFVDEKGVWYCGELLRDAMYMV